MRSRIARTRRRVALEDGLTFIELLVTISAFVVLIAIPLTWLVMTIRQQDQTVSRSWSVTQAEGGLERLTRDLRQVVPGTTTTFTWNSSSAGVTLTVPQPGTQGASTQSIIWSCTFGNAGTCTRAVGAGAAVPEINNVSNLTFAPRDAGGNLLGSGSSTQAVFVAVTLTVKDISSLDHSQSTPVKGGSDITLADGVDLRNNSL